MTHRTCMFTGLAVLLAGCNVASEAGGRGDGKSPPAQETAAPQPPPRGPAEPVHGQLYVRLSAAALSPDGTRALTGYAKDHHGKSDPPDSEEARAVKLWNLERDGELLRCLGAHDDDVCMVGFLPDSKRAVSAGGKQLKGWDLETGKELWTVEAYTFGVHLAALSPDGKSLLTYGTDVVSEKPWKDQTQLRLWRTSDGKPLREFRDYCDRRITGLRFSLVGEFAFLQLDNLARDDIYLQILDVSTGETKRSFKKSERIFYPCAISPDGLLAASDRWDMAENKPRLVLWEVPNGKEVRTFGERKGGRNEAQAQASWAAFMPNGKELLSCDDDGVIRLWDVGKGEVVRSIALEEPVGKLFGLSADGKKMLTAYGEGHLGDRRRTTLVLWDPSQLSVLDTFKLDKPDFDKPE